jgi:hypothetical protein
VHLRFETKERDAIEIDLERRGARLTTKSRETSGDGEEIWRLLRELKPRELNADVADVSTRGAPLLTVEFWGEKRSRWMYFPRSDAKSWQAPTLVLRVEGEPSPYIVDAGAFPALLNAIDSL